MPQQDKNWSRNVPKALSKQGCMEPEYCVGWSLTTSWSWAFGSRGRCAWGCCSTSSEEPQSGLTQGTDLRLCRNIWRSVFAVFGFKFHWILDPGPEFWSNLDSGPDPGLCYQFWKKNKKIILERNNFLTEIFGQLRLWMVNLINLCLKSYIFCF